MSIKPENQLALYEIVGKSKGKTKDKVLQEFIDYLQTYNDKEIIIPKKECKPLIKYFSNFLEMLKNNTTLHKLIIGILLITDWLVISGLSVPFFCISTFFTLNNIIGAIKEINIGGATGATLNLYSLIIAFISCIMMYLSYDMYCKIYQDESYYLKEIETTLFQLLTTISKVIPKPISNFLYKITSTKHYIHIGFTFLMNKIYDIVEYFGMSVSSNNPFKTALCVPRLNGPGSCKSLNDLYKQHGTINRAIEWRKIPVIGKGISGYEWGRDLIINLYILMTQNLPAIADLRISILELIEWVKKVWDMSAENAAQEVYDKVVVPAYDGITSIGNGISGLLQAGRDYISPKDHITPPQSQIGTKNPSKSSLPAIEELTNDNAVQGGGSRSLITYNVIEILNHYNTIMLHFKQVLVTYFNYLELKPKLNKTQNKLIDTFFKRFFKMYDTFNTICTSKSKSIKELMNFLFKSNLYKSADVISLMKTKNINETLALVTGNKIPIGTKKKKKTKRKVLKAFKGKSTALKKPKKSQKKQTK